MSNLKVKKIDVLCVGNASFDLTFAVANHPGADEKSVADSLVNCGGGPAANAAVTVARLGFQAAFAGFLGNDLWGDKHFQELLVEGVWTELIVRGPSSTPLSVVLVKPDGKRSLINYRGQTDYLSEGSVDFSQVIPKVILFDGHEPHLSLPLAHKAKHLVIPTILDAGSVHTGTRKLMGQVDYLICSEKFAQDITRETNWEQAVVQLSTFAPTVVITLGAKGLVWKNKEKINQLPAFKIDVVDSTGAGDAFHGAVAAGLAAQWNWEDIMRYASAVASLTCSRLGGRIGIPTRTQVSTFLMSNPITA